MTVTKVLKHTLSLMNTDHVKLDSRWNYKNVISPYHRIYYIDEGYGEITDTEKVLALEPGYIYIIPHYTLCNLRCDDYLSQYFVQFFEDSADTTSILGNVRTVLKAPADEVDILNFKRLIKINPGRGINRSDNPKIYEKNIFYNEYQVLNNYQSNSDFLQTQGILLQLVAKFCVPEGYHTKSERDIPVKILEAIRFITINLHQPLSVRAVADHVNLNAQYFSRLFEHHTGVRPQNYIIEKRIDKAKHILSTGQMASKVIIELTGFKSISDFSRTFKKITGVTPQKYRGSVNRTHNH